MAWRQVAQKLVEAGKRVIIRDRIAVIHEVMKEVSTRSAQPTVLPRP